ncbi:MAG TPA: YdcF family protein [Chitinophagaceae bacterium]|nr:YdcF family protein [Chitinophagaceae bacterium]
MRVQLKIIWPGLFFSILINSCSFSAKSTKKLFDRQKDKTYDVIIVPGVPFKEGIWSRTMKARVYWSKYLFEKGIAKNVMYSGSAVYTPYYEAKIMALYAQALGIPAKNIFTEIRAEHSTENVYYSYKKAKQLGFKKIALASDPFQTRMLRRYIRKKVSADVDLLPFVIDTLKMMEPQMTDPKIDFEQATKKEFIALPQREGFWKRFRGTRGLNVDTSYYN